MTLRPAFWRRSTVIPLAILLILCGTPAALWPHQAAVLLVAPVLLTLIAQARTRPVRMEITPAVVQARQGGWRGQPDKEAPRSEIRAIHYFPGRISFRGPDDKPIMEPEPHWTLGQMLKVADELDVPLYDHRGRLRLEELATGRLVYDPASHQRVQ